MSGKILVFYFLGACAGGLITSEIIFLAKKVHRFGWRAGFEQFLNPHLGYCGRCCRPWSTVEGHDTMYDETGGMFPLCERCWEMLLPSERLPYYRALWARWLEDCPDRFNLWPSIEKAVLEGR